MEHGPVMVISGATRGVGRAVALACGGLGARLVLIGRTVRTSAPASKGRTLEDIGELLSDSGAEVITVAGDVSDSECVVRIRSRTMETFGRCDVLINAASTIPMGPFFDVAPSRWMQGFSVNVMGPVLLAQAFLPEMVGRGSGRILSVSSSAVTQQDVHRLAHEVTRAGIDRLTTGLATEFGGRGVAVNAVRIDEPMTGLDHIELNPGRSDAGALVGAVPAGLAVEEVAQALCWVAAKPLSFNGNVLTVADLRRLGALRSV